MCKIVHVLRRFSKQEWGGIESAVWHLAMSLQKEGIVSPVLCTDALSHPGKEEIEGVSVYRFPSCMPWWGLKEEEKDQLNRKGGNALSFSLFWHLLKESQVDLIHTHTQNRLGGIVRTIARLKKIPYVVSLHGGYFEMPQAQIDGMLSPTKNRIEWGKFFGWLLGSRKVIEDAEGIICVGKEEFNEAKKRWPNKNIAYIPNGVDISRFTRRSQKSLREHLRIPASSFVVLCVSRLDSQKNQRLLLEAFMKWNKEGAHCILIGPISIPSYAKELEESAKKKQNIHILPGLSPDDPLLISAFQEANLFVLPSIHEPFGIVILEAWAARLPVIASRVGGIPGFTKDGENILLFDPHAEGSLLQALQSYDENRGKKLAENGYQEVQKYDWSVISRQVIKFYEDWIFSFYN